MTRTLVLRVVFVFSLIFTGVLCTTLTYSRIRDLELEIGRQTYESVAVSALAAAKAITHRKIHGGDVVESIVANAFPDAKQWPMVGLNGYYETANTIASLSGQTSIAFIVLVEPDEVDAFEEHTQEHYRSQGYPEEAGTTSIGFGIRRRSSSDTTDVDVFDQSGNYTTYGSTNQVLTPVFDHSNWDSPMLMYNVHVSSTSIESIIECSKSYNLAQAELVSIVKHNDTELATPSQPNCSVVTGFKMTKDEDLVGLIYKPIYPRNDPSTLVGMIGLSVNFKDVLVSVVPDYYAGITAVISTHSRTIDHTDIAYDTVTYNIVNGEPRLVGEGDLHDKSYDDFGHKIMLNDFDTDAPDAVIYTLTIYPSGFYQFQTKSPMAISLGFVGVIIASSCIFFLYDYLMRRQSDEQALVLDMKRRFVRFISHEIRTPLNTVSMGLELLEQEIRSHRPNMQEGRSSSQISGASSEAAHSNGIRVDDTDLKAWYEITRDVQENAASAVSILNDLLNYDKIENGTLQLEINPVAIVDLVTKAVRKFHVQAVNKDIELNLSVSPNCDELEGNLDGAMVVGDDMRLSQVVCNLISNSLKFTPSKGRVDVFMERRLPENGVITSLSSSERDISLIDNTALCERPRAGSILVTVKDTGAGMTKDQVAQLFGEGVQFDANKLQAGGGSGLGLCISKGIVDRHNGIVSADSDGPGAGSAFLVELPLFDFTDQDHPFKDASQRVSSPTQNPATADECPPESSNHRTEEVQTLGSVTINPMVATCTAPQKQYHHILVVEDVASSRKMLIRLLQRAGHTCEAACDGQEAVEMITQNLADNDLEQGKHQRIDTVLMDFEMPRLNGPEATEQLRALDFGALIIGVTGNVLAEDVDYFISKGANRVLPKPVSMDLLNDAWKNPQRRRRKSQRTRPMMLTKLSSAGSSFLSTCSSTVKG